MVRTRSAAHTQPSDSEDEGPEEVSNVTSKQQLAAERQAQQNAKAATKAAGKRASRQREQQPDVGAGPSSNAAGSREDPGDAEGDDLLPADLLQQLAERRR